MTATAPTVVRPEPGTREFETLVKDEAFGGVDAETSRWLRSPDVLPETTQALRRIIGRISHQIRRRHDGGTMDPAWRTKAEHVRTHAENLLDALEDKPGRTHRLVAAIREHQRNTTDPGPADLTLWLEVPEVVDDDG